MCKKISEIELAARVHNLVVLETVFNIERMITEGKDPSKEASYYISSKKVSAKRKRKLPTKIINLKPC